jgi:hypothetical protein
VVAVVVVAAEHGVSVDVSGDGGGDSAA